MGTITVSSWSGQSHVCVISISFHKNSRAHFARARTSLERISDPNVIRLLPHLSWIYLQRVSNKTSLARVAKERSKTLTVSVPSADCKRIHCVD